ncbi:MAG: hypothetical protein ABI239_03560 [Aquihabitans sp.]
MQPDEADETVAVVADASDAAPEASPVDNITSPGSIPPQPLSTDAGPAAAEAGPDLDGGGDPACWMGLIVDQRDHQ